MMLKVCYYLYVLSYIVVYVYVYLNGQTVNQAGGGTIINWSET